MCLERRAKESLRYCLEWIREKLDDDHQLLFQGDRQGNTLLHAGSSFTTRRRQVRSLLSSCLVWLGGKL